MTAQLPLGRICQITFVKGSSKNMQQPLESLLRPWDEKYNAYYRKPTFGIYQNPKAVAVIRKLKTSRVSKYLVSSRSNNPKTISTKFGKTKRLISARE